MENIFVNVLRQVENEINWNFYKSIIIHIKRKSNSLTGKEVE